MCDTVQLQGMQIQGSETQGGHWPCGYVETWCHEQLYDGGTYPLVTMVTLATITSINVGCMAHCYIEQATFCGSSSGKLKGVHYTTADFEAMGYHFCDTLLDYCDPDPSKVPSFP